METEIKGLVRGFQPGIGLARGTNQSGVRLYNERLVLSLIRRHGALPKAEIARQTGLSAQTITVIMRQLDGDRLVRREKPLRGKIGQPSVPFSLNKDGAFSVGIKVGRRSTDVVLIDFVGNVIGALHHTYSYPTPEAVLRFIADSYDTITAKLPSRHAERISGVGIAMPFQLWSWAEEIGAPAGAMDGWKSCDIRAGIGRLCGLPAYFCNDATAACAAELVFGVGAEHADYLYLFVGTFIGGGLVLDGNLYPGRRGNAAAFGSMPIPHNGANGVSQSSQLIQSASIYVLEEKLTAAGMDAEHIWRSPDTWEDIGSFLDDWIDEVSTGLAFAIVSATAVIDIGAVIIDGACPAAVRTRLVESAAEKYLNINRRGLSPVEILSGTIGNSARAIGGASLPLLANFTRDREVLFKEERR